MQLSSSQIARLLQPYPTPPADNEHSSTPSVFFSGESGSVALSPETHALDADYNDYILDEIYGSMLSSPPTDESSQTSSELFAESIERLSLSQKFHIDLVPAPDALLLSSDGVFFCVHLETIHRHCPEAFNSFLDATSNQTSSMANPVVLDCHSEELNIVLHALYDMSLDGYHPSPETVAAAIDSMPHLSITVKQVVYPECALYQHILSYTPARPLEVYAMAAHHGIHALAVQASAYLLNMEMFTVSDGTSDRMGPLYFMKLIRLHSTRSEALKAILLVALPTHPPALVDRCTFEQQQQAEQIWALFCSEPLWHTRPIDFAVQAMEGTLHPMMQDLTCTECRTTLRKMVARVRSQWISVPRHVGAT